MIRDLFTFMVGATSALFYFIPYEVYMMKINKEYTWFSRMWRVGEIEALTGLDVKWIEETQAWTGLQKECARKAAAVSSKTEEEVYADFKNTPAGYGKVTEKFEKNLNLGMDPYNIRGGTYFPDKDHHKKALDSVMEERNADRPSQAAALAALSKQATLAALLKHFPDEPVATATIEHDRRPVIAVKIPRTEDNGSEFERRADLVAMSTSGVATSTPEAELEANVNASDQNEQPVVSAETLAVRE